ncbi:hypothetical protein [Nonomuraea sp. SYSU D8015]|uniref:hypothetical protein n=1 Tax=Nonomuraea sp. SYSU D8015 TaxID=2593644 RepID=UPI0016615EAA|nr:hypothetical protein [Nonomuraea sp. SYSU D8015]
MKLFVNSHTFLPVEWSKAVGQTHVHNSAHLVVIAARKSEGQAMLVERGQSESLMDATKLVSHSRLSTDLKLLTGAGVIDLETPAVYIFNRGVKNDPVFRVEPDGTLTPVAYFRYESKVGGRDLFIEPVTPRMLARERVKAFLEARAFVTQGGRHSTMDKNVVAAAGNKDGEVVELLRADLELLVSEDQAE